MPSPTPISREPGRKRMRDGHILSLADVNMRHVRIVGGKAASLGEMIGELSDRDIRVPQGFVTTVALHRQFLSAQVPPGFLSRVNGGVLPDLVGRAAEAPTLRAALEVLLEGITADTDPDELGQRSELARRFCLVTPVPAEVRDHVVDGYSTLCTLCEEEDTSVAVRSSGTREDAADASFAGQFDTFLNVCGTGPVVEAWRECVASGFTERAMSYQLRRGMSPLEGAISVIVMRMVRSDLGAAGIVFTLDPDSGNRNVVHVTSSFGLGELVVGGGVTPDTFRVWKEGIRKGKKALVEREMGAKEHMLVYGKEDRLEKVEVPVTSRSAWSLEEEDVLELARMALTLEDHYGQPMDIEWAKDGRTGEIFITQARPETVHGVSRSTSSYSTYSMDPELLTALRAEGRVLLTGQAVGQKVGSGKVRIYRTYGEVAEARRELRRLTEGGTSLQDIQPRDRVFEPGDVLVTELTTPDWEPLMKVASLIITERGGRTSHAAIVAREFGVPAIVGCAEATTELKEMQEVTGTCAEGDVGLVLDGLHPFRVDEVTLDDSAPPLRTRVKLNVGFPDRALTDARLPCDGVGLARLEFLLTSRVGVHPLALVHQEALARWVAGGPLPAVLRPFRDRLESLPRGAVGEIVASMRRMTAGYTDGKSYFVERLASGIALICAAFHPRPVLVRLSDLKSNEYRSLLGGELFEPDEENPMLAWRGAARFTDPRFRPAFDLELEALQRVRWEMGLDNLEIMVPFCRTPEEGSEVLRLMDAWKLSPRHGVPLSLMVEVPSNVLQAESFIKEMELSGGSIGTNDLVQTVYAVSRDDLEGYRFAVDARAPAVREMIQRGIKAFTDRGLEMGICGQAPSDHPEEVVPFLVESGITSISVTPDTFFRVHQAVREAEEEEHRSNGERRTNGGARTNGDGVRLTPREGEVIDLIAEGMSNKAIGKELHISLHTVKSHLRNIMEKLTMNSRLQLATYVYKRDAAQE